LRNYRKAACYYDLGLSEIALFHDISAEFYFKKSIEFDSKNDNKLTWIFINGCEERIKWRNEKFNTYQFKSSH
jgi:hypothetical protein